MSSEFSNNPANKNTPPASKVFRKKVIEGVSIPAFIRNGGFYFTNLDVYEDGRVNCWNFEDLEHFKQDVRRGWVSLQVPDNKAVFIHGLGSWIVTNGSWLFDNESFIEYVVSLIRELNPEMINLFQYKEKKVNGIRVGESGSGTAYKPHNRHPNDMFPEKIKGEGIALFYKSDNYYHLVQVTAYADHTIQVARLETPLSISFPELKELVDQGILLTELPENAQVKILGLGSFTIGKTEYVENIHEKLLEIQDLFKSLNDEPDSIDVCRAAYQKYLDHPTLENKALLKASYEKVPEHQRRFVGDMDSKDIPVRMIIYGDQEIEGWSHYAVAKNLGEKLPSITVPKPKDDIA